MNALLARPLIALTLAIVSCADLETSAPVPEEAPETRIANLANSFPPAGFTKVNRQAFRSHASYSTDPVNIWVNDAALPHYLGIVGPSGRVEQSWWSGETAPPPARFPKGTLLIREDTTTDELAVMGRLSAEPSSGVEGWMWAKRQSRESGGAVRVQSGWECWGCHNAFSESDGAVACTRPTAELPNPGRAW